MTAAGSATTPAVGHLVREFLPLTETFIYEQLRHIRRYRPVVLAGAILPDSPFEWDDVESLEARLSPHQRALTSRLSRAKVLPPAARRAVAEMIGERAIECVHAHFGDHAAYYSAGIPEDVGLLASFYGYDATSFPRRGHGLGARVLRRLFRRADRVLALSNDMRRDLIGLGAAPERVIVHHLGISLEKFPFAPRDPDEGFRLLFIGRLVEKKGIVDLMEALASVRGDLPGLSCDVHGDGELLDRAQAAAAGVGLGGTVTFHGPIAPEDVPAAMRAADAFVLPSKRAASGDKEGQPTVIHEAMATGLPVISTLHAGIPEMIEDGHSGLLVPEGDVGALGAAIVRAAREREARVAWARHARATVERRFDADRQAARLETLYDEVIAERPSGSRPGAGRGSTARDDLRSA